MSGQLFEGFFVFIPLSQLSADIATIINCLYTNGASPHQLHIPAGKEIAQNQKGFLQPTQSFPWRRFFCLFFFELGRPSAGIDVGLGLAVYLQYFGSVAVFMRIEHTIHVFLFVQDFYGGIFGRVPG